MLFSVEMAMENADRSMSSLFEGVEKLKHTVEAIDQKVYSFTRTKISIFFVCLIAFMMFIVILCREPVTWGLGIFSGLWGKVLPSIYFLHLGSKETVTALTMATLLVNEPGAGSLRNNMTWTPSSGLLYSSIYELSKSPGIPDAPAYFSRTALSTVGWLTVFPICYLLYRHSFIVTPQRFGKLVLL